MQNHINMLLKFLKYAIYQKHIFLSNIINFYKIYNYVSWIQIKCIY